MTNATTIVQVTCPFIPTILTSLSECHIFCLVLTSPDVFHHPSHHCSTLSLKKRSTKSMATTSSQRHFNFENSIFDFASSHPYLSPHSLICDCQSHTCIPSQFPCLPALYPRPLQMPDLFTWLHPAFSVLKYPSPIPSSPSPLPETATTLTGGEYPLPLACSRILSPLPHSLIYGHHSCTVASLQVS